MKNLIITKVLVLILAFASTTTAQITNKFFADADQFFSNNVSNGLLDYGKLKNDSNLKSLITQIENASLTNVNSKTKKAFLINAYNLHVINAAAQRFPLSSVTSVNGFFDGKKITVAGEKLTLNDLEKKKLIGVDQDARLHFVLVCGALGCPPITNFAYSPDKLENQLEQQTKLALNNPSFIKANGNSVELSQIFKWYEGDFGGNKKSVLNYINQYRTNKIDDSAKVSYYSYDWTLNDQDLGTSQLNSATSGGNNASRYVVSSTIPKGTFEGKIFNNLYTQQTGIDGNLTNRSNFFTVTNSLLYGLSNRFNIGVTTRYRRVSNDQLPSSALSVLGSLEEGSAREGFTAIGPQIRWAPIEAWSNFSIQSSFTLPIGSDLAGSETQPYIDWNGATWWTQFFNDFSIGNNFSLFTEIDFLIEDIGSSENGHINRVSTPATAIFSYNPTSKTTLYTLGSYSPYWQADFDYFYQYGVGAKYQITPKFEVELLYSDFTNEFLNNTGGQAATYNLGIRFNL